MIIPAEISIGGILVPRLLFCGIAGFTFAWLTITLLRRRGWSRFIWHLPLFFLALWTIVTFTLEIVFLP